MISAVPARADVNSDLNSRKENRIERREFRPEKMSEIKERLSSKKSENRVKFTEKKKENFERKVSNVFEKFDKTVLRLENISDKIETRIEKMEIETEKDLTVAKAKLIESKNKIADLKLLIESTRVEIEVLINNEEEISFEGVRISVKEIVGSLKTAKNSLVETVKAIK